jgi:hypothetical protein
LIHLHSELSEEASRKFRLLCRKKEVSQSREVERLVKQEIAQYEAAYGKGSLD